eukprot:1382404-Pyramimonas_sp.AAC.1
MFHALTDSIHADTHIPMLCSIMGCIRMEPDVGIRVLVAIAASTIPLMITCRAVNVYAAPGNPPM